jgi:hypothetical protein
MAKTDLNNNINPLLALDPGTYADQMEAFVGHIIDVQGYEGVEFLLSTGTAMNPGSNILVQLYESDVANLAVNNVVAADDLLGAFPGGMDGIDGTDAFYVQKVWKLGYIGTKRYLQLALTVANTGMTDGLPIAAVAVLGDPHSAPTPEISILP